MLGTLLVLALSAVPARAADLSAADALYFHRDQGRNLDKNIAALDELLAKAPGDAELLWRKGRALVRRGEAQARRAERLADYLQAEDLLKRAVELSPRDAEIHFWYGVAMGRRGETQGIMKSLFLVKPIRREEETALRLDPNHGGAHRVLGEILWQVPGMVGGDKKRALAEFEAAVRTSPNYTSNYQPLAEAYVYFNRKQDAIKILKLVEAVREPSDPAAYAEDLADARKLLEKLSR